MNIEQVKAQSNRIILSANSYIEFAVDGEHVMAWRVGVCETHWRMSADKFTRIVSVKKSIVAEDIAKQLNIDYDVAKAVVDGLINQLNEETQMTTTKLGTDFAKDALKVLNTRILKIAKAENIVHTELGAFSREVLEYVLRTKDVTPVNRIIGVDKDNKAYLTRNNRVVAMHFFAEFLPFTSEGKASEASLVFGKLKGERSQEKCTKAINDFLHNPEATIWTWAKENIQTEKKPVDYAAKVGNAITAALAEDKGNMSKSEVLLAVLRNGISIDDMLDVAKLLAEQEQAA